MSATWPTRDCPLLLRDAAQLEPEAEVLLDRHLGVERVVLEHHRDVAVARSEVGDVAVADQDSSLGDLLEPGDHAQKGRLAAPGRADEHHELAVMDVERDVVDRLDPVRIDLRRFLEPDAAHQAGACRPVERVTDAVAVGSGADAVRGKQKRADDGLDVGVHGRRLGHPVMDRGTEQRGGVPENAAEEDERERLPELPGALGRHASVVAGPAADVAHDVAGDDVAPFRLVEDGGGEARPLGHRRQAVVDAREDVEQVLRARPVPELERAREHRGGRCEPEHVPPDRRERLGAERVRARRIGPEAEMEDLAGGVPRADGAVGADHRRDSDPVIRPAAKRPDPVVDDHRLTQKLEAPCQLLAEEDEVLGPVGAGEAEGGGGEVGRRGARGRERLVAGPHDLDEGRLGLGVVDICRPGVAPPEHGPVAVRDEGVRLRVAAVDAEEERARAATQAACSRSGR